MTIKDYRAAAGAHLRDEDARIIGPVLQSLAAKGKSDTAAILAEARKSRSPLHRYFEWDDANAASAHRKNQAEYIARSILVTVETASGETRNMRAFLPIRIMVDGEPSQTRHYLPVEVVQADTDYAAQAVLDARRQLRSFYNRFRDYAETFGALFPVIAEVLAEDDSAEPLALAEVAA